MNVKNLEINLCNQTFLLANVFWCTVSSFVQGLVSKIAVPEEITIKSHFHFFTFCWKIFFQSMFQHYLLCPQLNNCRIFSLIFHCWCFRNLDPRQLFWAFLPWDVLILVPVKSSHKAASCLYICARELPVCRPSMAQDFQVKTIHFLCFTLFLIQDTIQFFIDLSRGVYSRSCMLYYCECIIISQPKHILLKTSHLMSMFQSHVVAINSKNIPVHFDTCKTANMRFTRGQARHVSQHAGLAQHWLVQDWLTLAGRDRSWTVAPVLGPANQSVCTTCHKSQLCRDRLYICACATADSHGCTYR